MPPAPPSEPSPASLAHPWRRLAAAVIDALILLVPCAALVYVHPLVALAAAMAYGAIFEAGARHATPGKRACGIEVEAAGARGAATGAIVRNVLKYGSLAFSASVWGFLVPVALFVPAFAARRQGLHDLAARTDVRHERGLGLSDLAVGAIGVFGPIFFAVALLPLILSPVSNARAREAVEAAIRDAAPRRQRVEAYFRENGNLPPDARIDVRASSATGSVALVPEVHGGSLRWRCEARDIPRGKLPADCRGD